MAFCAFCGLRCGWKGLSAHIRICPIRVSKKRGVDLGRLSNQLASEQAEKVMLREQISMMTEDLKSKDVDLKAMAEQLVEERRLNSALVRENARLTIALEKMTTEEEHTRTEMEWYQWLSEHFENQLLSMDSTE